MGVVVESVSEKAAKERIIQQRAHFSSQRVLHRFGRIHIDDAGHDAPDDWGEASGDLGFPGDWGVADIDGHRGVIGGVDGQRPDPEPACEHECEDGALHRGQEGDECSAMVRPVQSFGAHHDRSRWGA